MGTANPIRVSVVIVNYRTAGLTIDCLRSLVAERADVPGMSVVVTDNDSGDDSAGRITAAIQAEGWGDWASVMPLERNGGFAYGNNAAIAPALGGQPPADYVLLLNPDTVIRPGAIRELISFMESHPRVGIAGSRLEDPDGSPQRSAFRFQGVASELEEGLRLGIVSRLLERYVVAPPVPERQCRTDWVAGASMMVRRAVFEQIGLLDEGYFMYFEEVDFCLRAARAGWECWYVPESRVVHLVGQASGVTDRTQQRKRRPAYWFESRRRYFVRNHGRAYAALADTAWAAGYAMWRVRRAIQSKPDTDPAKLLGDFIRHSVLVRGFGSSEGGR
jgi:N-acetylglucosaminyl-diphospho-decaprenol L-rhamnosyltransferase